jgi:hypothetical protein
MMWKEADVTRLKILSRRLPGMSGKTSKYLSLVSQCPAKIGTEHILHTRNKFYNFSQLARTDVLSMDRSVKHVTVRSRTKPLKIAGFCLKCVDSLRTKQDRLDVLRCDGNASSKFVV